MSVTAKKIEVALCYADMQEKIELLCDAAGIGQDACVVQALQEAIGEYADAEIDYHVAIGGGE